MKSTFELIKEVSLKVANESELSFLKSDVENAITNGENDKETVENLERAFVNANYAGDYKAGEISFILNRHLNNYDVREMLEEELQN